MTINSGINCQASQLLLDLMPDHSVRITLQCASAMEAGILYQDISESAHKGSIRLLFGITRISAE